MRKSSTLSFSDFEMNSWKIIKVLLPSSTQPATITIIHPNRERQGGLRQNPLYRFLVVNGGNLIILF